MFNGGGNGRGRLHVSGFKLGLRQACGYFCGLGTGPLGTSVVSGTRLDRYRSLVAGTSPIIWTLVEYPGIDFLFIAPENFAGGSAAQFSWTC